MTNITEKSDNNQVTTGLSQPGDEFLQGLIKPPFKVPADNTFGGQQIFPEEPLKDIRPGEELLPGGHLLTEHNVVVPPDVIHPVVFNNEVGLILQGVVAEVDNLAGAVLGDSEV